MKRIVRLYSRATYVGTGNSRTYLHALELADVLGQGDAVIFEVFGHRKDADARTRIECYASIVPGQRPSEVGQRVLVTDPATGSPTDYVQSSALRPPHVLLKGPFPARVELLLTINTANAGATPAPEFDLELWGTVLVGS